MLDNESDMSVPAAPASATPDPFLHRIVQVAGVVVLLLLAWQLAHLLLLVFGSIIVATILRNSGNVLRDWCHVPEAWSLPAAGLILVAVVGGVTALLGQQITEQLGQLGDQLAANIEQLRDQLVSSGMSQHLNEASVIGAVVGNVTSIGKLLMGGVADSLLVLVSGVYLALDPALYRRGTSLLFPRHYQPRLNDAFEASGNALTRWLMTQLVAMAMVGSLSLIGLYAIGMPSPLALALIAGATEFIPYLGPWLGAIPALLVAWSQGPDTLLWAGLLYLGIQQVEAFIISPLLARQMVAVPPALGLFAVVAFGMLLGPFGLVLAFPLTIVTMVLVIKLYVQPELDEDVPAPGEQHDANN